jgi:GDP-4-dehydro-6-deoxy-D-mannose reductase
MKNALITGSLGFVGRHLTAELLGNGYTVCGIDIEEGANTVAIDLLDRQAVRENIRSVQPDVIFHLAAQAAIPLSWKEPQKTFELNVIGTINLLEAVSLNNQSCTLIIIGSADQYGYTGSSKPISENEKLLPRNPYAISKTTQEELALLYAKTFNLDVRMARPFNHCGPGQRPGFLVSDICLGLVDVEKGVSPCLKVGNLEAIRDFTDVRDIVAAYRLIYEKGKANEVYNVGSGYGRSAQEVLDLLLSLSDREIEIMPDKDRMRVSDTPVFICDNTKLKNHTGWSPSIPLKKTLRDALEYYRNLRE